MKSSRRRLLLLLIAVIAALSVAVPATAAPSRASADPCKTDCLRVFSIKMYDWLAADAEAHVQVVDENGGAVRGAVVHGEWTLPDGSTVDGYDVIGTRLRAEFPLYTSQSGTVTFTVAGIRLKGYTFDPVGSALLSASMDIGDPGSSGCMVDCLSASGIKMSVNAGSVRAVVVIVDETGAAVGDATVAATWTLPDGSTIPVSLTTNRKGKATFMTSETPGVYMFDINEITGLGLTDDSSSGVTGASILVR